MEYVSYNGIQIPYQVVKSNRKTISIRINYEGVIVHAPKRLSNAKIADLIQKKAHWICEKHRELSAAKLQMPKIEYCDGSQFSYRGRKLTLKLYQVNERTPKKGEGNVWLEEDELRVVCEDHSPEVIKGLLEEWYRQAARLRFESRVHYFTLQYDFGKEVNRIFIKDQKSRWGSCSSKCNLNFNYRLIMAPDEVLDYVVVHELCHLKHMNHSREFWEAVEQIQPEYNQYREWLRKNGNTLRV